MTDQINTAALIIADSGGGLTLQVDGQNRYQHYYSNPADAACDILEFAGSQSVEGWDGNDLDDAAVDWLDPSFDDIRNGGYRVLTIDEARAGDSGWHNIDELAASLRPDKRLMPAKKYYRPHPATRRNCRVCGGAMIGTVRRLYCSRACQQAAYRARRKA